MLLGRILCRQLVLLAKGSLVTATGNSFPPWLLGKGLMNQSQKFHAPPSASLGRSPLLPQASCQGALSDQITLQCSQRAQGRSPALHSTTRLIYIKRSASFNS